MRVCQFQKFNKISWWSAAHLCGGKAARYSSTSGLPHLWSHFTRREAVYITNHWAPLRVKSIRIAEAAVAQVVCDHKIGGSIPSPCYMLRYDWARYWTPKRSLGAALWLTTAPLGWVKRWGQISLTHFMSDVQRIFKNYVFQFKQSWSKALKVGMTSKIRLLSEGTDRLSNQKLLKSERK